MIATTRLFRVLLVGSAVAVLAMSIEWAPQAQQSQPYTKWDQYGGSSDSMQYSALTQINKTNVKQLERAWFYPVPGDPERLGFNPLVVDNVMYVSGVRGVLVALDAATGKELWMSTLQTPDRGLAYWESKDRSDRRIILTASNGIREVDARTGRQILTFGNNGFVDMRLGTPRRNGGPNSSPGRVFENLLIVGSNVGEGYGSPPGDIRAYDIVSGKLVWTFHTIPRPGEYGYETWPEDAFRYAGGANTWGDLTLDEKNGIVFLPTGSPTHDLYGGDRQGNNLFGNCLLALDARTGKRLWHFQVVHHDLWDYDNAAAPKLLTVNVNGTPTEIVAQAGKTGFLYVFERKTGKPLWPIEERPVPKSEVPGEFSSPTQPIPTKPPPFARQSMTPEEVNPFVSPEEQEKLKQLVREAANEGVFTPSSHLRPHIQFPGAWGGANWGSTAGDPQTGMVYVRSLEMISYRKMSLVTPGEGNDGGRGRGAAPLGPREQQGQGIYMQRCSGCHGPGQMPMRSIKVLGSENF
jgi:quinoprotein glucose dehydrogenase